MARCISGVTMVSAVEILGDVAGPAWGSDEVALRVLGEAGGALL